MATKKNTCPFKWRVELQKISEILSRNDGKLAAEAVYFGLKAMKENPSLLPSVALEVGDAEFNK